MGSSPGTVDSVLESRRNSPLLRLDAYCRPAGLGRRARRASVSRSLQLCLSRVAEDSDPGAGQEAREGARAQRSGARKGGRQAPGPAVQVRLETLTGCGTCAHTHTDSHFQSCLSNRPRGGSVRLGGRGGPPCPRNLAGTPDKHSFQAQAAPANHQEMAPANRGDSPKRVRLTAGLPKSHRPVLTLQQRLRRKASLAAAVTSAREGGGPAAQHLIPGSLRSRSPGGPLSRWRPRVKHEDRTVPQGC